VITQIRLGQAQVITARRELGTQFILLCGSQSMNPRNSWKPTRWIPDEGGRKISASLMARKVEFTAGTPQKIVSNSKIQVGHNNNW